MIADRLIESGALGGDVVMDGEKVGRKTAPTVSKSIAEKAKKNGIPQRTGGADLMEFAGMKPEQLGRVKVTSVSECFWLKKSGRR